MTNIVILISGRGSNMQAIVDAQLPGTRVAAVIANRPDAAGLAWAAERGVDTAVLDHKPFDNRADFDSALADLIDRFAPDVVVLAGFMRILTPEFVAHYAGRLINIHPSLLPAYTGLNTHARALADGVKFAGCTVHFVTAELDHGPIIAQAVVPVLDGDDEKALSARVLAEEHRIYPQAVALVASGLYRIDGMRVLAQAV
ncbi:phosphoribosylglycinamide formyltransferase [Chitinibacteraceae bacterium HSL-7]